MMQNFAFAQSTQAPGSSSEGDEVVLILALAISFWIIANISESVILAIISSICSSKGMRFVLNAWSRKSGARSRPCVEKANIYKREQRRSKIHGQKEPKIQSPH